MRKNSKKRYTVKANKNIKRNRRVMASSSDPVTYDLSEFGMREIEELRDLLDAWLSSGLPDDFYDDEVRPAFNKYSGEVFLTNSEYQACIEADGHLETWYYTPYSGYEGVYDDLVDEVDESWESDDIEYLIELAQSRGDSATVDRLTEMLNSIE